MLLKMKLYLSKPITTTLMIMGPITVDDDPMGITDCIWYVKTMDYTDTTDATIENDEHINYDEHGIFYWN
jgi:hypothetical protein